MPIFLGGRSHPSSCHGMVSIKHGNELCVCIVGLLPTPIYIYVHIQLNLSKSTDNGTDIRWPIYGGDRFRELENHYNDIVLDPNKAIDVGKWSICGGGRLDRLHCVYKYIYIYSYINIQ